MPMLICQYVTLLLQLFCQLQQSSQVQVHSMHNNSINIMGNQCLSVKGKPLDTISHQTTSKTQSQHQQHQLQQQNLHQLQQHLQQQPQRQFLSSQSSAINWHEEGVEVDDAELINELISATLGAESTRTVSNSQGDSRVQLACQAPQLGTRLYSCNQQLKPRKFKLKSKSKIEGHKEGEGQENGERREVPTSPLRADYGSLKVSAAREVVRRRSGDNLRC